LGLNNFRLEELKKVKIEKEKAIFDFQTKDMQKEGALEFFSVLDWGYPNLGQDLGISNQNNIASGEIYDLKDLFDHLEKINKKENSEETFWIQRSNKQALFKAYTNHRRSFEYPRIITPHQRAAIIWDIKLEIYERNFTFKKNYLEFLEDIQKNTKIESSKIRTVHIGPFLCNP
jgi:hypothetical protein